MENEYFEEKEMYVYLDFGGCLEPSLVNRNDIFFKVIGLDQEHPLVQVGDYIFEGTYEDCVGTNIFFEEVENRPVSSNIFERDTPISLNYVAHQTKVLSMKYAKLPDTEVVVHPKELKDFKIEDSYEILLEKLNKRTLNFDDIKLVDGIEQLEEVGSEAQALVTEILAVQAENTKSPPGKQPFVLNKFSKFDILKNIMTHEQLKHRTPKEKVGVPPKLKMNYEYYNLRNKLVRRSEVFPEVVLEFNVDTLEGAVDICRCVRMGLIEEKGQVPRILTEEEKNRLLTLDNYENLSIPMRYCVVRNLMKKKKKYIKNAPVAKLQKIDPEFGVNVVEVYKLLKAVCTDLKKYIIVSKGYGCEKLSHSN